jgi:hypothetical protein
MGMAIREITDDDLESVRDLLVEGFPQRSFGYWTKGLANLSSLPPIDGFPRYGYLVDADDAAQGVLLTISSDRGFRDVRTNLSSWYVRKGYRQFATTLFAHALTLKNTTFLNPSPSDHVVPILEAFGFEPYTGGVVAFDLRTAMRGRSSRGEVHRLGNTDLADLSESDAEIAADHLRMGCGAFRLEADGRAGLLIHRRKWVKRSLPCSQVILADHDLMTELAGPVMRALASRGSLLVLCDVDQTAEPAVGRVFRRGIRYFKGQDAPRVGDLSYSELAVFGP